MKKIQRFLAAIALLATLSGFSLQGATSLTSNVHVGSLNASSLHAVVLQPVHIRPNGPCAGGGGSDC